jgi:glycosyltransferase involved in cell wall biosynthesis
MSNELGIEKELPKVSVLVLIYSQETFVREAVESVVTQYYPNIEYAIADDGFFIDNRN